MLDKSYPSGALGKREMLTILALSGLLVTEEEKLKVGEEFFRNHVNYKTKIVNGYFRAYREGVKLLDEKARALLDRNKSFFELSLSERERVLQSILWKYRADEVLKPMLERVFLPERNLAFREFVVKDLLTAFYKTAAGWRMVSYSHYPGVPAGDPTEYINPVPESSL